jgi:hypothetical protein
VGFDFFCVSFPLRLPSSLRNLSHKLFAISPFFYFK